MKKLISLVLLLSIVLTGTPSVYAQEEEPSIIVSEGIEILSVEVIPNVIADAQLPEELAMAIASLNSSTTYGTSKPSTSNVWNLSTDGDYDFTIVTKYDTVYSNYVFTGHNGHVKFIFEETSGNSGYATFKLMVRNFWNTTIYNVGVNRSTYTYYTWDTLIGADELIYFGLAPGDVYTNVSWGVMRTFS